MNNEHSISYTLQHRTVGGAPLLELYASHTTDNAHTSRPLFVLYHGFGSSKERKLQHAYLAARAGFFVLLPDAARHGERLDEEFAAMSAEEGGALLVGITRETAGELPALLRRYKADPRVNGSSVCLAGTSMGGMIVYDYLRRFGTEGISCAVPIISSPAWTEMTDYIRRQSPEFDAAITDAVQREIEEHDPFSTLSESLRDFPLLMLSAEDDELMPIDSVRRFYRRLRQGYTRPELLRLEVYTENGHMTSEEMMQSSVEWARHYLQEQN